MGLDDNQSNVLSAKKAGYDSILAKAGKAWIENVISILEKSIKHDTPLTPISLEKVQQLNSEIFSSHDDSPHYPTYTLHTAHRMSTELPQSSATPSYHTSLPGLDLDLFAFTATKVNQNISSAITEELGACSSYSIGDEV